MELPKRIISDTGGRHAEIKSPQSKRPIERP